MVSTWRRPDRSAVRILARGNFSLDAAGLVNLLISLTFTTLGLAGLLAWLGYWPILLIAAVQLVLIGWILVRFWQRNWVSETIDVGAEQIFITRRRYKRERRYQLDTAWTIVELKRHEFSWYSPNIYLRSGARSLELGAFLVEEEKQQLYLQVKNAIEKHSAMKGAFDI